MYTEPQEPADPTELPESIGEYRVVGLLGEGAVARVYAAIEPGSGRNVAIKVLREGQNPEHRTVERFIAEVRAVEKIRHRNIIDIYAFGALADGRPYFVMEHQPGLTLQQRIDRDGPLTFLEAAPIFIQACEALEAAHALGIVHRDLKPDNIYLVTQEGGPPWVKLLDFGIAKLTTQQSSAALTQVGSTVGTPLYMSPEQIRALPLDARSDVYTLGVSLFQTLTGEVPFYADSHAQTATMHLSKAPPRPSEVYDLLPIPEQAETIVLKCLAKNPAGRYQGTAELRAALEAAHKEVLTARQLGAGRVSLPSVPPLPARPPADAVPAPAAIPQPAPAPTLVPRFSAPALRPTEPAIARAPAPASTTAPTLVKAPAAAAAPSARQPGQPGISPHRRAHTAAPPRPARRQWLWIGAWYVFMVGLGVLLWYAGSRLFDWPH